MASAYAAETIALAVRNAVVQYGGVSEQPTIVYRQLRPPEQVWPVSLKVLTPHEVMTPVLDKPMALVESLDDLGPDGASYRVERIGHHAWGVTEWVSLKPPTYDSETNTLTFHGYYRTQMFDVWRHEKGDADGE